jgi:hypothetical protein
LVGLAATFGVPLLKPRKTTTRRALVTVMVLCLVGAALLFILGRQASEAAPAAANGNQSIAQQNAQSIVNNFTSAVTPESSTSGPAIATSGKEKNVAQAAQASPPPTLPSASTAPTYQQNNYGTSGTNISGPVSIYINPSADPSGVVKTYDFNGGERTTSPGNSQLLVGKAAEAFHTMETMSDARDWQHLLDLSDAEVIRTQGKWVAPYVFKGVALIRLGRSAEGTSLLQQAKAIMERRDDRQKAQYNELVARYLPSQ